MNLHVLLAEDAVTQAMVDDTLPNPRLHAVVRELDRGSWAIALTDLRQQMADHPGIPTREALIAVLDDLHTRRRLPIADLQILAIGFYRLIWRLLVRIDPTAGVDDIRHLDAQQAARLCYGFTFGLHPRPFPVPEVMVSRFRRRFARFISAAEADHEWQEDVPLPLGVPLVALSDRHLSPAGNAIRNIFFSQVCNDILGTEDPQAALDAEALVLDYLLDAEADPQLMCFLGHVAPAQVRFRLVQLTQALIALHQVEAEQTPSAASSRGIPLMESAISCLLSPFASLRSWLRANRERLLIPVVRQVSDEERLLIHRPAITIPRPESAGIPTPDVLVACHRFLQTPRITT